MDVTVYVENSVKTWIIREDDRREVNQTPISFWYWNNLWTWHSPSLFAYSICTYTSTCTRCSHQKHVSLHLISVITARSHPTRTESEISSAAQTIRQHLRQPPVLYNVHNSTPVRICLMPYPRRYFFNISLNITSHLRLNYLTSSGFSL
jgi:hypothetical protein